MILEIQPLSVLVNFFTFVLTLMYVPTYDSFFLGKSSQTVGALIFKELKKFLTLSLLKSLKIYNYI